MHRSLIRADAAPARPKPDRGDEANIFVQHLRREIFSDGQFGDWSAKFGRDFKGKFCQPDRQFESYLVRHAVHCFSIEISLSKIVAEDPQVSRAKVGAVVTESAVWRMLAPCGCQILRSAIRRSGYAGRRIHLRVPERDQKVLFNASPVTHRVSLRLLCARCLPFRNSQRTAWPCPSKAYRRLVMPFSTLPDRLHHRVARLVVPMAADFESLLARVRLPRP
jgi:hypothetical protein